ncbi:MAG: hypothetical protein GY827_12580 [Cytophagales bacterium]|nr:hypothetical protein [Cytophagales bacterium]
MNKKQKWINTILCFIIPVLWNVIALVIIPKDRKSLTIVTKKKRRIDSGTNGDALTN